MTATLGLITILLVGGCVTGGCAQVKENPYYQKYVSQPYDKAKTAVGKYRDKHQSDCLVGDRDCELEWK